MVVGCYRKVCLNGWILHLIFTHCSSVPLLSVRRTMCSFNPLSFTIELPHPSSIWLFSYIVKVCALACCLLITWNCVPLLDLLLCAGQNGLPPTPDTLHFGCSYHLHPSHPFLSTWGAVMLKKKKHEQRVTAFKSCKWV